MGGLVAIPSSNIPGLRGLHKRACDALDYRHEIQSVDFKRSETWGNLKWAIIKTVMGMGNLRDGGIIIIGVDETGDDWKLTGIDSRHFKTYDHDNMIDQIHQYVSPHVNLDIAKVTYQDGKNKERFLAIRVHEFSETPLVCKKNGPAGTGISRGAIYVRPPGKPQTTKVTDSIQTHDLVEIAAEKKARKILEQRQRTDPVPSPMPTDRFDDELGGL